MKVPDKLASSVRARWPDRADTWLTSIGPELDELTRQHSATPQRVLPARYAFVVSATSPHGPLIFRASPDPAALDQATVAEALGHLDVGPKIHLTTSTDTGSWTVMEQVIPGTPLADANPATLDIEALARPLRAMAGQPAPSADLPLITDWLRDRLTNDNLTELPVGEQIAPKAERVHALELLDDLAADMRPGLCHGDASPWNILAGPNNHWKLIDPRGMQGEPEYDAAVVAYKLERILHTSHAGAMVAAASGIRFARVVPWMHIARAARI
ncbi:phosphotransferase [Amycolatopsis methanolica]|uniref:Aminoglycoside phosphotransferase n=1 Tax=Amycolatopsis methanolica 239 TaxID=1068978 RepID=A0A076N9V6_AMYME|nr:phosphotransferase [Amycolatopsis methanolica]AIJ26852.1 aminoglycoside phosphotransferase [Amycolatopsis methanolica 239]